ncbi:MAG: Ppx/GppA family phosphatase [Actinomycetales bacterium]|jgi:exopolyphosphatase/guanosine-5'-triphosphate,3'-diphosphate pyrophosphatase|nr:Ppx/GppA family phosphatase [Actinomycetales bacterium]
MRLGVLDVGSNTVHLQVVDTYPGARPNPTSNLKIDLRLIEFIDSSGFIRPEGIEELRSSIKSCLSEMKRAKATQLLPFATSALREAGNGSDVINLINDEFDIDLQVLSGEEEAQITFLAARRWFGWSSGRLLMIDIGGGSLELAVGVNESPDSAISLPLGASRLTKEFLEGDPFTKKSIRKLRDEIESKLAEIIGNILSHQSTDRAIGTSKTLRTLARLTGDWADGDGKSLKLDGLRKILPKLSEMTEDERRELPGVSKSRARQIVAGAFIAEGVMRNLEVESLEICPWALREGIVLKWMDWIKQ